MKRRGKREALAEWQSASESIRPSPIAPQRRTPPEPLAAPPEPAAAPPPELGRVLEELGALRDEVQSMASKLDTLLVAAKPKPRTATKRTASKTPARRASGATPPPAPPIDPDA